ncbi:hypothetical protein AGABI1DRAFT_105362 [Agaricus bisporus var. burnettii JB137-S8]|uniref:Uncharacterized protein n=1 Tax=Agaricus bisporus var. burnettii (strain JB137-S8 / ATCC MYA-4627 / FGSC 10392) TaxID=597362 RepID=K5Y289_AGABU|nr:uncharacterized protein AGABI1DRAFT_105362 [Agaricus bisporus var. burnettii JB137-S8]EKM81970.1 hypothetical protein AGABI1DRAFT_105362 [Agaricus bisporus var. burnettii JB137-S8]
MPPRKVATKSVNASSVGLAIFAAPTEEVKVKVPSTSDSEEEEKSVMTLPTVPSKKPIIQKASGSVKGGSIRRGARQAVKQEEDSDSLTNEVSVVQAAAGDRVTTKPVNGSARLPASKRPERQGFDTSVASVARSSSTIKSTATPQNSAATLKSLRKSSSTAPKAVALMNSTARKSKSGATSKRHSASFNYSSTGEQETAEADSGVPEQYFDEIAALKAKLARIEATIDECKKNASSGPMEAKEIPEPRGKYNLQEAMGLKGQKLLYNSCRATVASVMACANLPTDVDWRRQDSIVVADIFSQVKELEPRLAGFERNWAIAAIVRTINKNKRNYHAKLAKNYVPPKLRIGDVGPVTGAGIEDDEDAYDHNSDDGEPAESDNNSDANEGFYEVWEGLNEDEEEATSDLDRGVSDLDEEMGGSESDYMEEEDGGTDEEEYKHARRKSLKRPLLVDDDSDEDVDDTPRKKMNA